MPIPERVRKPDSVRREEESELKQDASAFRPMWLDGAPPVHDHGWIVRVIVITLALYGLYSLIF